MQPSTIKIFLPLGDPKRLRIAEISNWSGKAIAAPRTDLSEILSRPELEQAGVYLLTGTNPDTGQPIAYIGEAEILKERIKIHKSKKDSWNQIIVFVSKDENLTKAHVRYLEHLLIKEAQEIGRSELENIQGSKARLPEADRHETEVFMSKIRLLLPILGTEILTPVTGSPLSEDQIFTFTTKGLTAKGKRTENGFVIYASSEAAAEMRPGSKHISWLVKMRDDLIDTGKVVEEGQKLVFRKNVEFSSPSAAAAIVCGGAANGLKAWKDQDGTTLKELEAEAGE